MERRAGLAACVLMALLVAAPAAPAAEGPAAAGVVHFLSAPTPPTELQRRLARQRGEARPAPRPGLELGARLTRPRGPGPFPAVVLLHGCTGASPAQDDWAAELAGWGFVALQVDSFAARGVSETCTTTAGPNAGPLVFDAFGALAWLRGQPLVDARRVAVMGWGHGGTAALDSVLATGTASVFDIGFAAAVALYPYCPGKIARRYLAPILVLAGGRDDLMPAARCRRIAANPETGGDRITLVVYDGAYYGFDDPALGAPHPVPDVLNIERSPPRGATFGYDAAAHADALRRVRTFLERFM
ncbi:MAG: dienelactone hydrolase family protein [Kiloniellaceae bacterium]